MTRRVVMAMIDPFWGWASGRGARLRWLFAPEAGGPRNGQRVVGEIEMDLTLLDSRWVVALVSTGIGAFLTSVCQKTATALF